MFSQSVKVEIPEDTTRQLSNLMRTMDGTRLLDPFRAGCVELTKSHLYALANTRHRDGVAHNFYRDAGDAVSQDESAAKDEILIRIDKAGVAQRYYGGEIKATNYSHLWIPVHPNSIGKSAGEFKGLVPIISPLTNKGVALKDGEVYFALVESLYQHPDSTVIPSEKDYQTQLETTLADTLDAVSVWKGP